MGDAFIVRRGGMADAFAVIAVAYPEGSACTCTKGSKTLRAKDTSGYFLFLIPEAGTWTVSCTDGTKTKSQNVVIQWQYEAQWVQLAYTFDIIRDGELKNGFVFSRAEWETGQATTFGTADGAFFLEGNQGCGGYVSQMIDFSPFSELTIDSAKNWNQWSYVSVTDSTSWEDGAGNFIVNHRDADPYQRKTYKLDVSSVSGEHYFKIHGYTDGTQKFNIYNIWLE